MHERQDTVGSRCIAHSCVAIQQLTAAFLRPQFALTLDHISINMMQYHVTMGYPTSKALKYSLRAMSGLSTALGVGFIVWGVIIQNPPETALTMYVA